MKKAIRRGDEEDGEPSRQQPQRSRQSAAVPLIPPAACLSAARPPPAAYAPPGIGSALNTNVHFHTLLAQGVFFQKEDGTLGFAPAPAPTDLEVARLLAAIRRRIVRLVKRQGIDLEQPTKEVQAADEATLRSWRR